MDSRSTWVKMPVLKVWGGWLCAYPPLLAVAIFLLSIVCLYYAEDFGIPKLFWHDDSAQQFLAGIGVAFAFSVLVVIGYLLDAEREWMSGTVPENDLSRLIVEATTWRMDPTKITDPYRALCWYASATFPWLLGLSAVPAVYWFQSKQTPEWAWRFNERWPFLAGEIVYVFAALLITAIYQRTGANLVEPVTEMRTLRRVSPELRSAHALALVFFTGLVGLYLLLIGLDASGVLTSGPWFPAALAICIVLSLIAAGWGFIAFHFRSAQLPVVVAIVAIAVLMNSVPLYKQRFPGMDSYYDRPPVSLEDYDQKVRQADRTSRRPWSSGRYAAADSAFALIDSEDALENWRARYGDTKPKVVVVSTQGGGIRAGVWTMVVLSEIEKSLRTSSGNSYASPIRLITGASGGMLGATYYAATLSQDGYHRAAGRVISTGQLVEDLCGDSLTVVAQRWTLHDLPMVFVPFSSSDDRGLALEQAWERSTHGLLRDSVRSLGTGEREGWRPSIVFSPTLVEDGRRLLISNLDLHPLLESKGNFLFDDPPGRETKSATGRSGALPSSKSFAGRSTQGRYAIEGLEFFRLFPDAGELRLSTAVRMNASFPYVSPSVALPTEPRRRVTDAGYYDNYGVNLAALWLDFHKKWLRDNTSGVVLVQIRDYLTEAERRGFTGTANQDHLETRSGKDHPEWNFGRGLEGVTGPLTGIGSSMQAVTSFRNDEQVQALDDYFNPRLEDQLFTTVVFECPRRVALNWYLSEESKCELLRGFSSTMTCASSSPERLDPELERRDLAAEANIHSLQRLKNWWAEDHAPISKAE